MINPDPCFRCTLPDCDETSPGCVRRMVLASARRKKRTSDHLTSEEAFVFRENNREWKRLARDRIARASSTHA